MKGVSSTGREFVNNRWITPFVVLNLLLYVAVAVHLPLSFFPGAGHDDGLFMQHAVSIVRGHWLGLYSQFTLMKGPGYPVFLAVAHLFGIPGTLAEAILYCVAVLYLSFAVREYFSSRELSLLVFVLSLWNFGPDTSRINRDSIVAPLYLIVFSGLILGLFVRRGKKSYGHLLWGGFAFGFSWITREDAVVLVVTVLMLVFAAWARHRSDRETGSGYSQCSVLLKKLAVTLSVFCLTLALPSIMNYAKYRYFGVVDFKGDFQSALESLQSIKTAKFVPYVPVPLEAREIAYKASPTFNMLKDSFEQPSSPVAVWKKSGCPIYPQTCGDYAGGWFMWAFRDAAALQGAYGSAQQSSVFYRRVHSEIRAACKARQIACYTTIIPFMPHISWQQARRIPASVLAAVSKLSFYDPPSPRSNGFIGDTRQYWEYGPFLGIYSQRPADLESVPIRKDGAETAAVAVYNFFVKLYHWVLPALIGAGFLSFLGLSYRILRHPSHDTTYWIVLSLWLTLFAKVFLLALVDVTSFPAIANAYLAYAFPVVVCASVLSLYLAINRGREQRRIFVEAGPDDENVDSARFGSGSSRMSRSPGAIAVSAANRVHAVY